MMGNRHSDPLPLIIGRCEIALRRFHFEGDVFADVLETGVAHERTGQQSCFQKHLKPVANADNHAALFCEINDCIHDRRPRGNRAAAQIIAKREATWNCDKVQPFRTFL